MKFFSQLEFLIFVFSDQVCHSLLIIEVKYSHDVVPTGTVLNEALFTNGASRVASVRLVSGKLSIKLFALKLHWKSWWI